MEQEMNQESGEQSPKMAAIQALIKFLMESEARRAQPQEAPDSEPLHAGAEATGEALPEDVLAGLKGLPEEDPEEQKEA